VCLRVCFQHRLLRRGERSAVILLCLAPPSSLRAGHHSTPCSSPPPCRFGHAPPLWSLRRRPPALTPFTLCVQTIAESIIEATPSTPVRHLRRLHVAGEDAMLIPHALSIVELHCHTKVYRRVPPGQGPAPPWCRRSVATVLV
jgi:hypothetical protein